MDVRLPEGDSTRQLIDPGFLKMIKASDPLIGSRVQSLMKMYPQLIALGWSQADIEKAAGMGYSFEPHLHQSQHDRNRKFGSDARPFYAWVRHYYRRDKAEKLGMSLEEYIALWVRLRSDVRHINLLQKGRLLWVDDIVTHYMRARRFGLEDSEIRHTFFYHLNRAKSYFYLRRRFDADVVQKLLRAADEGQRYLREKYVLEARRRGASLEAILANVKEGTIHKLALNLRETQKE